MAIPKVCGIETVYGILVRGPVHDNASNPVTASSLLINAYLAANHRKVGWDFEDEHPGVDARGCLLYTSDAADERSSVDLGGRPIIKKTKQIAALR